jgi:signal transduction histidine kinase
VQAFGDTRGFWDEERLDQVVTNLFTNAIKHGAPSEIVGVRLEGREKSYVVVEVSNRGTPIPPDLLPVIFDPFRRGEGRYDARSKGVGLGLYIAERILAAHGGTVSVRSSADDGTTFTVTLPRGIQNAD